jgi:hypothetical protein
MCYQVALGVRHVRQFLAETPFSAVMTHDGCLVSFSKNKTTRCFFFSKYCTGWLEIPEKNSRNTFVLRGLKEV